MVSKRDTIISYTKPMIKLMNTLLKEGAMVFQKLTSNTSLVIKAISIAMKKSVRAGANFFRKKNDLPALITC